MKFKQIEKKYPKAHNEFMIYCESQNLSPANWMDVRDLWKEVTDFFDKRKIIIGIYILSTVFFSYLANGRGNLYLISHEKSRSKPESKAIEAAFKILEDRLQEETK